MLIKRESGRQEEITWKLSILSAQPKTALKKSINVKKKKKAKINYKITYIIKIN